MHMKRNNRIKYAVFADGVQMTEFSLTIREAERIADGYEAEGRTTEIVETEWKLEETAEYWK